MVLYERIKKADLRKIVADYAEIFYGWQLFDGVAFFREEGPIRQMVWFEALRTGDYRPLCGISASVMPTVRMLPQMLDVKHRQSTQKQHLIRKPGIEDAMKEQFLPNICKQLDLTEVFSLCSASARETTNDLAMLAIISGWLGRLDVARDYSSRALSCPSVLAPVPEWEAEIKAFCASLAQAIETGSASEFLRSAVQKLRVSRK